MILFKIREMPTSLGLGVAALLAIVISCGTKPLADDSTEDDGGEEQPPSDSSAPQKQDADESSSFLVVSKNDLVVCQAARKGFLAYLTDEKKFLSCDGKTWNDVQIGTVGENGATGPAGAKGPAGATGATGATGAAGPIGATGAGGGGGVAIYDSANSKIGTVFDASWPYIFVLLNNGAWGKFNQGNYKVEKISALGAAGGVWSEFDSSPVYFAAANCSSDAAVGQQGLSAYTQVHIPTGQVFPTSNASGGGVLWQRIVASTAGGADFSYQSVGSWNSTYGMYTCSNSSGSIAMTSPGGGGGNPFKARITYTTFGGIPVASGGGTLSYPLAGPFYFGS